MDFLSRKLLDSDSDADDDDLNEFCNQFCLKIDYCSSDCFKKCPSSCSYVSISIPPPNFDDLDLNPTSKSPHKLPNLVTCTIALLSFTFLLVLCYAIYVRFYSGRRIRQRNVPTAAAEATHQQEFLDEEQGPVLDHPIWYIRTIGLPAAVIDGIAVCKFKSGEGLIDGTECSVCLSEFEEDETLRLLPKCNHAFHLPCIDTWLRSHTNCPMCRAPVVSPAAPATVLEETQMGDLEMEAGDGENLGENSVRDEEFQEQEQQQQTEIDLPDDVDDGDDSEERIGDSDFQPVRRSVSLDSLSALRISSVVAVVDEKMESEAELDQKNGNESMKLRQGRGNSSAVMNRSVSCSGKFLMRSSTQRSNGTNHC